METQVRPALRVTFLAHVVVAGAFGLLLLFSPDTFGNMLGETIQRPTTYREVGTALVAFAVSSILAYRQRIWERIKIVVQLEIIFTALAALLTLYGLAFEGLPSSNWMNAIILGAFAVAFAVLYYRE